MSLPYQIAVLIGPLVVAIVFHEVAHGWVARACGDPTAAEQSRLSLNPLRHVDPIGTVLLPLGLALAHAPVFGWAKPVPVDATRLRRPRTDMVLVALAGPATNLVLALLAALALSVMGTPSGGVGRFLVAILVQFIGVNVFLALFNLLPIPPFDGSHVVAGLLPRSLSARWTAFGRYGFLFLFGLLVILPMLLPGANIVARLVGPPARWLADWFFALAGVR